MNFPFICSNIPAAHSYGLYISRSRCDIQETVVAFMISLIDGCC